jgi:CYTH domain-containing protein
VTARSRYERPEIERRFLVADLPAPARGGERRTIDDRYLRGTRLRLRRQLHGDGSTAFKLTQKLPRDDGQGTITTIYLAAPEHDVLAALPGDELRKVRHRLGGPLVLDVFEAPLHGLLLAEAEFATIEQARAFVPPPICHAEVSADERFTGAALARAARADVVAWAAGYGVAI